MVSRFLHQPLLPFTIFSFQVHRTVVFFLPFLRCRFLFPLLWSLWRQSFAPFFLQTKHRNINLSTATTTTTTTSCFHACTKTDQSFIPYFKKLTSDNRKRTLPFFLPFFGRIIVESRTLYRPSAVRRVCTLLLRLLPQCCSPHRIALSPQRIRSFFFPLFQKKGGVCVTEEEEGGG